MKFLVDANLPPALVQGLISEGHEALHVSDLGMERNSDRVIWAKACEQALSRQGRKNLAPARGLTPMARRI